MIKLKDILKQLDEEFGGAPLVGPGGVIKGAPTSKQVKKTRKELDDDDLEEVYSEKQRRWACAQDDPKFDEMCKDTAISKKKKK